MIDSELSKIMERLSYNPDNGNMFWLTTIGGVKKFSIAGTCDKDGYICIRLNKKNYKAHRLAWLFAYGELPSSQIDHINGIKDDNRIENLRQASNQENARNRGAQSNSKTGIKGVSWCKREKKYRAAIQVATNEEASKKGRYKSLGYHLNIEDAQKAYEAACEKYHKEFANVG